MSTKSELKGNLRRRNLKWNWDSIAAAYSISTVRKLSQRYPSLRRELLPIVEGMIEQKTSAGILARAKRELKLLEAINVREDEWG